MKRYFLLLALLVAPLVATSIAHVNAVDVFPDSVCRGEAAQSSTCKDQNLNDSNKEEQNPLFGRNGVLTTIINLLTTIVAIVAVIFIILAGLRFITSGSNPQDVTKAREQIIYALLALAVAGLAQAAVRFIIDRA